MEVDRKTCKRSLRVTRGCFPAVAVAVVSTDNKLRKSDNYFRCQAMSVISSIMLDLSPASKEKEKELSVRKIDRSNKPFYSEFGSVQFNIISPRSEKPIGAPPRL